MFDDCTNLFEEFEKGDRLAWVVRLLLVVGRDSKTVGDAVAGLELAQGLAGQLSSLELHGALETVKQSIPGYQEHRQRQLSAIPGDVGLLLARLNDPSLSAEQREDVRLKVSEWFALNVVGDSPDRVRELMEQLVSPIVAEEEKQRVRAELQAGIRKQMPALKTVVGG